MVEQLRIAALSPQEPATRPNAKYKNRTRSCAFQAPAQSLIRPLRGHLLPALRRFAGRRRKSRRDALVGGARLAQDVTAAPDRLDIIAALRGHGQLLAQLADEDVDDLQLGLVHAAIEMVEKHLLGQRRPFAQRKQL